MYEYKKEGFCAPLNLLLYYLILLILSLSITYHHRKGSVPQYRFEANQGKDGTVPTLV